MRDTPTPGEVAYTAYRAVVLPSDWRVTLVPWADLPALHQEAWEAAAQAVQGLSLTADEAQRVCDVLMDPAVQKFIARDYGTDWERAVAQAVQAWRQEETPFRSMR